MKYESTTWIVQIPTGTTPTSYRQYGIPMTDHDNAMGIARARRGRIVERRTIIDEHVVYNADYDT